MTESITRLWSETNRLLARIASALEASAEPSVDLSAASARASMSAADLERYDGLTTEQEEIAATIEQLEEEGRIVPAESYKLIGWDPPRREDEPTEEEMERLQPGVDRADDDDDDDDDDEGVTVARRKD